MPAFFTHTEGVSAADVALVPPRRLGALLIDARSTADLSLSELADRSSGRFSVDDLAAIEAGERDLFDADLRAIAAVYDVDAGDLVPERSRLVIDLDERRIAAGPHQQPIKAPTADEVLATYLSLVYMMRNSTPGTPLPLRQTDVDVLSRALEIASIDVETRLVDLMGDPDRIVSRRQSIWRSRFLLPVAGVVVAVTAVGTLVLVHQVSSTVTVVEPVVVNVPAGGPPVSLIDPVVVERNADRTPGPQHVVGEPAESLAPAQVIERNPDGTPGTQHERTDPVPAAGSAGATGAPAPTAASTTASSTPPVPAAP